MATVLKKQYSLAEYAALEQSTGVRHEYYRAEVFAMAGASEAHSKIGVNLSYLLRGKLLGSKCFPHASDMRIKIKATGLYTYPDCMVVCSPVEKANEQGVEAVLNPRVIFEVLSKSTEAYDRGVKFHQYQTIPSLQEYLLVSQTERLIERFVRQPDGTWILSTFSGEAAVCELTSLGCELALRDVYADVTLTVEPA